MDFNLQQDFVLQQQQGALIRWCRVLPLNNHSRLWVDFIVANRPAFSGTDFDNVKTIEKKYAILLKTIEEH